MTWLLGPDGERLRMKLTGPALVIGCRQTMTKAHIDGTVDVEILPSEATIRWGKNQLSVEYGGEVSTVELHDTGEVLDNTVEVAPLHSGEMLDLAMGMYEQAAIVQDEI